MEQIVGRYGRRVADRIAGGIVTVTGKSMRSAPRVKKSEVASSSARYFSGRPLSSLASTSTCAWALRKRVPRSRDVPLVSQ